MFRVFFASGSVLVIDLDKQEIQPILLMNTEKPEKTVLDFMQGTATAQETTAKALFQSREMQTRSIMALTV